ncbi:TetR family transcriptional regulator [Shewanella intestini]|uniref:TetR/AcrR family transcriptional regulator n=1 Tax=Shewanella intestini TaxID=2017544 RepID=A0ABS5HZ11_9GAMM|nr:MULTISPECIES: TetR/AcrR family transcriptional regulator [Shewanella]MBR9727009.1 TetR/AcrR family transcriptional regulator [Shewanella intestini]MRG35810.1 TetR family transcriptional regulator [Shewanella sp. XMDDZSB0408]
MNTEEKLLHAAKWLVKEHGIINFSMSDIPRICGLSRASCYQHFRDKNEILATLCTQELMDNFRAVKDQRWQDISAVFTLVSRPLIFNHLKERDRLAIDNAFNQFFNCIELLPDNIELSFLKQRLQTLKNERTHSKLRLTAQCQNFKP